MLRVDEVVAMILRYAKQISETMADGTPIKDCVFTVPTYFTLNQRRMLLQAINIAGLNILNMVHENTAAAVIYGITN